MVVQVFGPVLVGDQDWVRLPTWDKSAYVKT